MVAPSIIENPTPDNKVFAFFVPDALTTTDNALIGWQPGRGTVVSEVTGQVKTAPVGADIEVEINIVDRATGAFVSLLGTLVIADGDLDGTVTFATPTLIPDTQALEALITQIGSGTPGSNMTIQVY